MPLNQEIKITVYAPNGDVMEAFETKEIPFKKSGNMSLAFSQIFQKALGAVDTGGAIFIERIWRI